MRAKRVAAVAAAVSVGSIVLVGLTAWSSSTAGPISVTAGSSGLRLLVSTSADRSSPRNLDGAYLSGKVAIFTKHPSPVSSVAFYLDDPGMLARPRHVEHYWPFDFVGTASGRTAELFDTSGLAAGRHLVTAKARLTFGGQMVENAAFYKPARMPAAEPPLTLPTSTNPTTTKPTTTTNPTTTNPTTTNPTTTNPTTTNPTTTNPTTTNPTTTNPTTTKPTTTNPTTTNPTTTNPTTTKPPTGGCTGAAGAEGGPDPWGTCWPGPATTGVPNGTALTVVTGNQTYSTANQVITGKEIRGCVKVTAPGVTIKNSKITCSNFYVVDHFASSGARLTLQDVTISCGNAPGTGIGETNVDVIRADISGCENGFDLDRDATVRDSYIHDLYQSSAAHSDGIQSSAGINLVLDHSVWYANNGTAAININNQGTGSRDTTISRNLLAGGAYSMYCPKAATTNYKVTDNRFSKKFYPKVGAYGPWTDCQGEHLSGALYADSGLPLAF